MQLGIAEAKFLLTGSSKQYPTVFTVIKFHSDS